MSEARWNIVADGLAGFACRMYGRLAGDGNLFFSPHSVSAAMSLAYAGARGQTAEQIAEVFGYPKTASNMTALLAALARTKDPAVVLSAANSAWLQRGFPILDEYRQQLEVLVREVDFSRPDAASAEINAWVEENTNNLIRDLVPPAALDALTRLVLVNAIHFKGAWTKAFNPERTHKARFRCLDGREATVDMMFAKEMDVRMVKDRFREAVRLPYGDGSTHMLVILPVDFESYRRSFDGRELAQIQRELDEACEDETDVALPKFKTESLLPLHDTLRAMGAEDAFEPAAADFSGITGDRDLHISAVLHKAVVDVSEEGTEAAAATAMTMRLCCARFGNRFTANKPFIFAICGTGNAPLFMGQVVSL